MAKKRQKKGIFYISSLMFFTGIKIMETNHGNFYVSYHIKIKIKREEVGI